MLLGHHELPGGRSLATYSRDMLSRPIQKYCAMLLNIRKDFFRPDLTRSGWMAVRKQRDSDLGQSAPAISLGHEDEVSVPSPSTPLQSEHAAEKTARLEAEAVDSGVDSATSSSSSTDSDHAPEENLHHKVCASPVFEVPGPLFQNNKSKVLRKASSTDGVCKCGIMVTDKFSFLKDGASLKWARCGKCLKGEVSRTSKEQ